MGLPSFDVATLIDVLIAKNRLGELEASGAGEAWVGHCGVLMPPPAAAPPAPAA